jgi:hypothetical protein
MSFKLFKFSFLLCFITLYSSGQTISDESIKTQIENYKNDIRGTYKSIQWFCNDGTIRGPKDPCPDSIGGIQHATYKDQVIKLAKSNHLFFGQILAYTENIDFWDASNSHSRLKQYQLGKYLARIDNGWVNRKGQYYRGAIQIEDEETWGVSFYKWLLTKDDAITDKYFLLLQSLKDIPHEGDDNVSQQMRAESKVISDEFNPFMNLRVKIHSNPEPQDIVLTQEFKTKNASVLSASLSKKIDELILTMQKYHQPINIKELTKSINLLPSKNKLTTQLKAFVNSEYTDSKVLTIAASEILLDIRKGILNIKSPNQRFILLKIVSNLERIVLKASSEWNPKELNDLLIKVNTLAKATAGTGGIELWEYEKITSMLEVPNDKSITIGDLFKTLETARGIVEWSAAMVKAEYQAIVNTYSKFEPKSYSFIDDRIRSSIALQLGETVGDLGIFIANESLLSNKVLDLKNQSSFRGLNPGYAKGELVVVNGNPDFIEVSSDKIYVFERAPADLKPVAGIATVAEGNLVSHVQLLARNLGIPNAALSDENLNDLMSFNGKNVFYAVSNRGNVILKLATKMTSEEQALFLKKVRNEEKIEVPVSEIRLDTKRILNLREVNAKDSGKLCGPKAANLGELKSLFPEKVVEGLVIPFGIFREHMDQTMPNQGKSYWGFLNDMFIEAENKRSNDIPEQEVENYQLRQLETLRTAIKKMELKPDFQNEISASFKSIFGKDIGSIPVFLRSDTNMEDLKDFTGAGLNLTIFNALEKEKILQGIKDVWASPYTERSFKWRQKYLLNPENVFPSILVIPSVNVDYSGVLITKGIQSGNNKDMTIAFSRGAGGAVDGQAAESWQITSADTYQLISPAREPFYNTLPATGGTGMNKATFQSPILNPTNLKEIFEFTKTIREQMDEKEPNSKITYDVELGFENDKLWLFQIRPFVENKKALSSDYLKSITPNINSSKEIPFDTTL